MRVERITFVKVTLGHVIVDLGDRIETPGSEILGHPVTNGTVDTDDVNEFVNTLLQ